MQDLNENVHQVVMSGVSVVNTAHDGYRRAGFKLKAGENILPPVTAEQWHRLEGDPRLVVTVITTDEDYQTSGTVVNSVLSGDITLQDAANGELTNLDGTVITPFPDAVEPHGQQEAPSSDERLLAAVLAAKIEPHEKWFTKKGEPRLDQWRGFVRADLTVEDIKAALDAHGVQ